MTRTRIALTSPSPSHGSRSRRRGAPTNSRSCPASATLDGPKSSPALPRRGPRRRPVSSATGRPRPRSPIDDPRVATVAAGRHRHPDRRRHDDLDRDGRRSGRRRRRSTVKNFAVDRPWSFRNHVLPVLTRAGCNSGACHGAAAGKNGLRLTLRGYGPEVDYDVLTRQALGRRINKTAPEESLFLLKPTGAIEHGGGVRFAADSPEYRVLAEWIAAGLPRPRDDDPAIVKLAAFPDAVRLRPGDSQQVVVQATYSDGRVEDVTRWAKFGSTDETVAKVDESGRLKVEGHGEAAVTVWFSSLVGRVTVTVPFETPIDRGRLRRRAPQEPDRREEPREAAVPGHPALARRGRRRLPPPGLPRRDRHPPARRAGRRLPRRPRAREASRRWSSGCWRRRSTSITGRTSGRTCSWSPRRSCPPPAMWAFSQFVRESRRREPALGPVRPADRHGQGEHPPATARRITSSSIATRST